MGVVSTVGDDRRLWAASFSGPSELHRALQGLLGVERMSPSKQVEKKHLGAKLCSL